MVCCQYVSDLIEHEWTTFISQRVSGGTEQQDDRGDEGAWSKVAYIRLFRHTLAFRAATPNLDAQATYLIGQKQCDRQRRVHLPAARPGTRCISPSRFQSFAMMFQISIENNFSLK